METHIKKRILLPVLGTLLCVLALFYFFQQNGRADQLESYEVEDVSAEIQFPFEIKNDTASIKELIFGYSEIGKEITGYEIGAGNQTLLIFASIHGNEMGTVDLMGELISAIRTNSKLVSKDKKVVIIPIVNPDGYYDRTDKLNANAVNLNLNFATSDWAKHGPEGQYAGEFPFSEKESLVVKQVVEFYKPLSMVSFHSRGSFVTPENNHASFWNLANWYATKTGYELWDDEEYDYPGTATKWFVETTGNPAITVELSGHFNDDWAINQKALLSLISEKDLSDF